jgi:hypothetical protein
MRLKSVNSAGLPVDNPFALGSLWSKKIPPRSEEAA